MRRAVLSPLRTVSWRTLDRAGSWRRRVATQAAPELYDVVVVGGGPAGCALAGALGSLCGKRIALVDSGKLGDTRQWEPPGDTYLPRALQITEGNKEYLARLGLWDQCYLDRIQAYSRAVVTDALGGGAIDLGAERTAAYMIETKNMVGGMLRAIDERRNVSVVERARVTGIERAPATAAGWPVVTLANGQRLQARLLVGADGASSRVRKFAGIDTYGSEYAQYGLVATLCLEELNRTAFQRFLPSGPVALLPFPGGFANLVWSLDAELFQLLRAAPEAVVAGLVNAAFRLAPAELRYIYDLLRDGADEATLNAEIEWRLDVFAKSAAAAATAKLPPRVAAITPKSRTSFPLRLRMVDSLVADRVALVGDAGHLVHPLAGQGLNMGLEDVRCLATHLEQAAAGGEDLGAPAVLERYNRERYARTLAMQGIIDKVWRVFGARAAPVTALRSAAMDGLDRLPALKDRLIGAFMS
ncbi:putative ubiquinone biosynthesis monooxygenase [Coemansia nantahalensis]|uniref:Ubiquinone biosynthesis monooxygenase n=1 Tax=Coemansia nantahalensis TaxID=2789366 RepID=A0ACC1K8G9_9FUNG|nr:putative ubiquinone biosynthesis monooxygenase [Coemansia nantahalensis]KAJ2775627.1 putative ubiquinone biosynthesis monooxygenase [Coemansia nantahalensis]